MEDQVHRPLDLDMPGHVLVHERELRIADVLDVLERPRVEVVDAHDRMPLFEEVIGEVRAEKTRTAGDDGNGHE